MKVYFLVDGFNLYHSILSLEKKLAHKTRWLNLDSFLKSLLPNIDSKASCEGIFFFTAIRNHLAVTKPDSIVRHNEYIRILEHLGIKTIKGKFKERIVKCRLCTKDFIKHEEKETDVAIATKIIELSLNEDCGAIVIVSGDTDLIPAIKFAKSINTKLKIYCMFPYARTNEDIKKHVSSYIRLKPHRYISHQLANPYPHPGGNLNKPAHW